MGNVEQSPHSHQNTSVLTAKFSLRGNQEIHVQLQ